MSIAAELSKVIGTALAAFGTGYAAGGNWQAGAAAAVVAVMGLFLPQPAIRQAFAARRAALK